MTLWACTENRVSIARVYRLPSLPALTSLRFFAALWVVLFHVALGAAERASPLLLSVLEKGYVSVTFFFVLSGFLMAAKLDRDGDGLATPAARRMFFHVRAARIWPVWLLSMAFSVVALPWVMTQLRAPSGWVVFTACAILLQAWWPAIAFSVNWVGWSLSAEMFFYAILPWTPKRMLRAPLPLALLSLWALSFAVPTWYVWFEPDHLGRAALRHDNHFWITFAKTFPLIRCVDFFIGILLGTAFLRGETQRWSRAFLLAIALTGLPILLSNAPYIFLHNALLLPSFGAVIVLATSAGRAQDMLGHSALRSLGEASYAMYALHVPLWFWMQRWTGVGEGKLILCFLAILTMLSWLVHRFVEEKIRHWWTAKAA